MISSLLCFYSSVELFHVCSLVIVLCCTILVCLYVFAPSVDFTVNLITHNLHTHMYTNVFFVAVTLLPALLTADIVVPGAKGYLCFLNMLHPLSKYQLQCTVYIVLCTCVYPTGYDCKHYRDSLYSLRTRVFTNLFSLCSFISSFISPPPPPPTHTHTHTYSSLYGLLARPEAICRCPWSQSCHSPHTHTQHSPPHNCPLPSLILGCLPHLHRVKDCH